MKLFETPFAVATIFVSSLFISLSCQVSANTLYSKGDLGKFDNKELTIFFTTQFGDVYARERLWSVLNAVEGEAGQVKWQVEFEGHTGKPLLFGDKIIVANVYPFTDAYIYAISSLSGEVIWKQRLQSQFGAYQIFESSGDICFIDSRKFGDSHDLTCLDGTTGNLKWEKNYKLQYDHVPPLLKQFQNIFTVADGGLHLIDAKNGDEISLIPSVCWEYAHTILDGILYYHSCEYDPTISGVKQHKVKAYEIGSHKELWSFDLYGDNSDSPFAISQGIIVFLNNSVMYALDAKTGEKLWEKGNLGSSYNDYFFHIQEDENILYLLENKIKTFSAIDFKTGTVLWSKTNFRATFVKLNLINGVFVVISDKYRSGDSSIHAFDKNSGTTLWSDSKYFHYTPVGYEEFFFAIDSQNVLYKFDAETGSILWQFEIVEANGWKNIGGPVVGRF